LLTSEESLGLQPACQAERGGQGESVAGRQHQVSMKYSIKKSEKLRIFKKISSYLLPQRKDITVAYLFGSFISEDHFSDIDLGILIGSKLISALDLEIELEIELEKVVRYQVDVRVLNNAPISFCQNVIRSGGLILDRNPNLRSDFEGNVLKQYFDFSRFRRRYLSEVINAPI